MRINGFETGFSQPRLYLLWTRAACLCATTLSLAATALCFDAADARLWGERLALSEMNRQGDSLSFGMGAKGRWTYETGVFLKGLEALWTQTGNGKYFDFLKTTVDSYLESDGTIRTYNLEDYNLDNINCGKLLLTLYQKTNDERYRKAALVLMKQLENQPRTHEGGFWHKKIYPYQMWLDGVYMSSPFLAQFAQMFHQPAGFDEAANQIIWIESHTRDSRTGLLYHGWDESREQEWADTATGCSKSFWGRAMGWYTMALVDVLDFMPETHPRRQAIIDIFRRLSRALANYQEHTTGLWYQVVDQGGRERNYLEGSASAMFTYALAKGVRKGYLGQEYSAVARKGYEGLVRYLVKSDSAGKVSLTQICSVAGLGGPQKRSGTFEYYVSEPVVSNDLKGVGAFILASIATEQLAAAK